jgi:hypothetical protein
MDRDAAMHCLGRRWGCGKGSAFAKGGLEDSLLDEGGKRASCGMVWTRNMHVIGKCDDMCFRLSMRGGLQKCL